MKTDGYGSKHFYISRYKLAALPVPCSKLDLGRHCDFTVFLDDGCSWQLCLSLDLYICLCANFSPFQIAVISASFIRNSCSRYTRDTSRELSAVDKDNSPWINITFHSKTVCDVSWLIMADKSLLLALAPRQRG